MEKKIPPEEIDKIIERKASKIKDFFFIQIGSNDGQTNDPIHKYIIKYGWRGILVEPVFSMFRKLKNTYLGVKGLIFENVAIDAKDGYRKFYRLRDNNEPDMPIWYNQLGSFVKEVVEKHRDLIHNFDKYFVSQDVVCLSFKTLLETHEVSKVDLLHIDTEGYDYEIIKLIPFEIVKPKMILYEHIHLKLVDASECLELLKTQGYKILQTDYDVLAYK
ncbi:MAG: FkbM family methyltransferase [Microgenomates group bacterium]